jgi:hypothetical protein
MKRSRRTLAGRPAAQRPGVGPAGGGHDEDVVPGQGLGWARSEAAQVGVVQGALGDVDDRAAVELAPPGGRSKDGGRGQDRPDEAHRGGEVGARVLEARHRRLQVGVDHLGRQVDEVAGKGRRSGLGQAAPSGEALNVAQHDVLGGPVHGGVAQPVQRARAGLQGHAERRGVAAGDGVGHDARCRPGRAGRSAGPRPAGGRRGTWSRPRCSRRRSREDGAQIGELPGQGADEDAAQVVLHAADAALGRPRARGWPPSGRGRRTRGEGHEAGAGRLTLSR